MGPGSHSQSLEPPGAELSLPWARPARGSGRGGWVMEAGRAGGWDGASRFGEFKLNCREPAERQVGFPEEGRQDRARSPAPAPI